MSDETVLWRFLPLSSSRLQSSTSLCLKQAVSQRRTYWLAALADCMRWIEKEAAGAAMADCLRSTRGWWDIVSSLEPSTIRFCKPLLAFN